MQFSGIKKAALTAVLSILCLTAVRADTPADLEPIYAAARSQLAWLDCVGMDFEVATYTPDLNDGWNESPVQTTVGAFRKNGPLIEVRTQRFYPDPAAAGGKPDYQTHSLWDGARLISYLGTPGLMQGHVSAKPDQADALIYSIENGAILDGFYPHNSRVGHYIDLFQSQPGCVTLRPDLENVNGHQCHVIEADTTSGRYLIWLDPANGHCMRRAEVILDEDDLDAGQPLRENFRYKDCLAKVKIYCKQKQWRLENIEVTKIGGLFIPISGTVTHESAFRDGSTHRNRYVFKRRNISLAPDFEALGAFKMEIPRNTVVYDTDTPDTRYRWKNGRLVPYTKNWFIRLMSWWSKN